MKVSQYKRADKAVTNDQSQNPIVFGLNLTFTLGVTNNGPQPATGSGFPTRFASHSLSFRNLSNGTASTRQEVLFAKLTPRNGEVGTATIATNSPSNGITVPAQGQVRNSIRSR